MPTKPKTLRPGRPPKDTSGVQQVCRVRLAPANRDWLVKTYGSVNAGLQSLVAEAMKSGD